MRIGKIDSRLQQKAKFRHRNDFGFPNVLPHVLQPEAAGVLGEVGRHGGGPQLLVHRVQGQLGEPDVSVVAA